MERNCLMNKPIKKILIKYSILIVLFVFVLGVEVCAQNVENMQVYNRNEKLELSKSLIYENEDYYISVNDLEKLNIYYEFEQSEEGFLFELYSKNIHGVENKLFIKANTEELSVWEPSLNAFVSSKYYKFSNVMKSNKRIYVKTSGTQVINVPIGEFPSVIISENEYYISLKTIATAISYEYIVNENVIKLWVTDSEHYVINGVISLPEGETAPENGINVNILIQDGRKATDNYILKTVCIPQGENNIYYFAETDSSDNYLWTMFEFDASYKTVNEFYNATTGGLLDVSTESVSKVNFDTYFYMPYGMVAEEDIYAVVIFDRCAVYADKEPVIKKGENQGKVTLDLDESFTGQVILRDITGDSRIFPYGYYERNGLRVVPDNATYVLASNEKISIYFESCYEISGHIVPISDDSDYTVRVLGISDYDEEISLYCDADENFKFSIKVPQSVYNYALSVSYKPGVYCNYVADGESSYSDNGYAFNNISDYTGVKLKYEPFLPDLPVEVRVNTTNKRIYVENISDEVLENITIYCAHYTGGKFVYLSSNKIDEFLPYSGEEIYETEYPKEFYKTDEVKVFVWDSDMRPLSDAKVETVNSVSPNTDKEFSDVDETCLYYAAIKNMYLSGVMNGDMEGTFRPEDLVLRSETAALMCRLMGYNCHTYEFSCEDCSVTVWHSGYVGICVNEGIFKLEDNMFRPNDYITVEEALGAFLNAAESINVKAKAEHLLVNINAENKERNITRGEIAQMMYNFTICDGQN